MVQSRADDNETWMAALAYDMDEAGASPASALAAFKAEEARYKAIEQANFHDVVRRVRDDGDHDRTLLQWKVDAVMLLEVLMGHRLEAMADNMRRLQDASQAFEVRINTVS